MGERDFFPYTSQSFSSNLSRKLLIRARIVTRLSTVALLISGRERNYIIRKIKLIKHAREMKHGKKMGGEKMYWVKKYFGTVGER